MKFVVAVALLHLLAAGLVLSACCGGGCPVEGESFQPPPWPIDVSVVFVSRLQTTREVPIEAEGRELRPGGTLHIRDADGSVRPLVTMPELYDVARPSVSPDGEWVVFSAVHEDRSPWCLYRVAASGGPALQLTFPQENPVEDSFDDLDKVPSQLRGVGDFSPVYLPDGRIAFSSTRYPTLAASCGQRSTNLYVMDAEGTNVHRITTTRSGLVDPTVMRDGRLLASYYRDNMNIPHPEQAGLRAIEGDRHWQNRYWMLWAMNPDGSGAARYANVVGGVDGDDAWGVHQPRELPSGDLVATVRSDETLIDRRAFDSAIAVFPPGLVPEHEVTGFGSILDSGEGHAMCPVPLSDGRILLSYGARVEDETGRQQRPDFDLHLIDGDLDPDSLIPLVTLKGTDELDAVPLVAWQADIVGDQVTHVPSEDPRVDEGTTAVLTNHDVYADMPLQVMDRLSPRPGTVAALRIYDDRQQFHFDDNPQLNKQMPILLDEVPVGADGSFSVEVPADRPIFFELVTHSGVAARHTYLPVEKDSEWEGDEYFVTVHDFLRPGTEAVCRGCHAGHMSLPDTALEGARTNLARLASIHHNEEYPSADEHFDHAPFRAIDQKLAVEGNRYGWVSVEEPELRLRWPADVVVDEVVLHFLPEGDPLTRIDVVTEGGPTLVEGPFAAGEDPIRVELSGEPTLTLAIALHGEGALGLSEVEIHGPLPSTWPEEPLLPPADVTLDADFRLHWEPRAHPMLGGYQLLVRDGSGALLETLDIGLVHGHTKLLYNRSAGDTVCLQLRPYDLLGRTAGPASHQACGEVPQLRIDSIEPTSVAVGEVVDVIVRGEGFRHANDLLVSIGGFKLLEFQIVDGGTIEGKTRPDKPREPGLVDVSVSYVNGQRATLEGAFELLQSADPPVDGDP